jgi:hypothetical protein
MRVLKRNSPIVRDREMGSGNYELRITNWYYGFYPTQPNLVVRQEIIDKFSVETAIYRVSPTTKMALTHH